MPQNTWQETKYTLDIIHATKGAHVEMHSVELKNFVSSTIIFMFIHGSLCRC